MRKDNINKKKGEESQEIIDNYELIRFHYYLFLGLNTIINPLSFCFYFN